VITYEWRGRFTNAEVNALHAEGFGHEPGNDDWQAQAERHSLAAAKCEWLHVDFEDHLRPFYLASCGFRPTDAGLIAL
jgi:hypothetical protein